MFARGAVPPHARAWNVLESGMSQTRTVPSIDALSSHRQSLLTVRSVMRSVWPRNRRTIVIACSRFMAHLHECCENMTSLACNICMCCTIRQSVAACS